MNYYHNLISRFHTKCISRN